MKRDMFEEALMMIRFRMESLCVVFSLRFFTMETCFRGGMPLLSGPLLFFGCGEGAIY